MLENLATLLINLFGNAGQKAALKAATAAQAMLATVEGRAFLGTLPSLAAELGGEGVAGAEVLPAAPAAPQPASRAPFHSDDPRYSNLNT